MQISRSPLRLLAAALALTAFVTAGCGVDTKEDDTRIETPGGGGDESGGGGDNGGSGGGDTGGSSGGDTGGSSDGPSSSDLSDFTDYSDFTDDYSDLTDHSDYTNDFTEDDYTDFATGDIEEQIRESFVESGLMSEEKANCLADGMIDAGVDDLEDFDVMAIYDTMAECGISFSDLGMAGG